MTGQTGVRPTPSVLALDLSLTCSGVCRPDSTTTTWSPRYQGTRRLFAFAALLSTTIEECSPDLVAIEGYAMGAHTAHAHALGELGGVVRLELWRAGIPYVEIPPACLKKFATGRGNASKDQVLVAAVQRSSGRTFTNDEADAWWLWLMALDHLGAPPVKMPEAQRAVLRNIHWPHIEEAVA